MAIYSYLDASTKYVTQEDARLIDAGLAPGLSRPHEYGAWIWVDPDSVSAEEKAESPMSPAYWALLDYARKSGCRWINLDSDGDDDLGLPEQEW